MNGSPSYCCDFCGETYGKKEPPEYAKWNLGECDVCRDEQVLVTPVHNFGGLYDTWRDAN